MPFYQQQLDFTCGPACLLMAMGAHDTATPLTLAHEVDIWREATLAAVPATSRHGLALAAHVRGFPVRIVTNHTGIPFRKRIEEREPDYYEGALDVLWEDTCRRTREAGIREETRDVTVTDVEDTLDAGHIPILLTSTKHFGDDEDIPHWVVVARRADDGFIVHNPLDDAPSKVHVPRPLLEEALGFEGEQELVIVAPRTGASPPAQPDG